MRWVHIGWTWTHWGGARTDLELVLSVGRQLGQAAGRNNLGGLERDRTLEHLGQVVVSRRSCRWFFRSC